MSVATPVVQHGLGEHSHGADAVPVQTRSARLRSVDPAVFPDITGREVDWKYTPVDRIRELIDAELDGSAYGILYPEVPGVAIDWVVRDDARVGMAGIPEDRPSASAWERFEHALRIEVDGETRPVTVTRATVGDAPRAAHTLIESTAGSSGLVILDNRGPACLVENVEIVARADSRLTVVTIQDWDDDALHLASHFARVDHGASLKHIVVSLGGGVVRVNPQARLAEDRAEVEMLGVYFADAGQHLEQQVFVHHDAANTKSRVTYKGALNGAGAQAVWIGDVLIGRTGAGTDSYEQNRMLELSDGTRAVSIPNLEIETGDIVGAGHASATGRFDDEQLFYLRSRGVPEDEARRLVVLGFLSEIVQRIGEPTLEARLLDALAAELGGGS